ncbi:uncharacterized [Tachysurus ichikawai]
MWTKESCAAFMLQIYISRDEMEDVHRSLCLIPLGALSGTPAKSRPYLTSSHLAYSPQCCCGDNPDEVMHKRLNTDTLLKKQIGSIRCASS